MISIERGGKQGIVVRIQYPIVVVRLSVLSGCHLIQYSSRNNQPKRKVRVLKHKSCQCYIFNSKFSDTNTTAKLSDECPTSI